MKFTVIIPCYNCEKTLEETAESVLNSGLYDFEIVLVDDGSTDGTAALCDRLCEKHGEIRCIHQQNAGVSAARNHGIDEARGDYIWFVDSDDTVDAGAMSPAVDAIAERQPDMLIFGMSFDYYRKGKMYRRDFLVPPCDGMLSQEQLVERFRELYEHNALTPVWNKLFRREILLCSEARFDISMHLMEDYLFVLDVLPHCKSISCLPEAIYHYRQGEDERGAYRRLRCVDDLAAYMKPFEKALDALDAPKELCEDLYRMLLRQRLYYASPSEIRKVLAVHCNGHYASSLKDKTAQIFIRNCKGRMRHYFAVRLKSAGIYKR